MPVPVTVFTGFLGAGKTTLLNRMLACGVLEGAALVINEFGETDIDGLLVERVEDDLISVSGGCLCCTVRGTLAVTLEDLLAREPAPRRIVIETTGIADPGPIVQTVLAHPTLAPRLRLSGVVTLVDAVAGIAAIEREPEAVAQLASADRVLVTKTDAPGATPFAVMARAVAPLAPAATVEDAADCEPARLLQGDSALAALPPEGHHHHHHHDHNRHGSVEAAHLVLDRPVPPDALEDLLDLLRATHGERLLRVKGVVRLATDPDRPVVIQGVGPTLAPPRALDRSLPAHAPAVRLVAITRDVAPGAVQRLFDAFAARPAVDQPDMAALRHNPLAIPGG